MIPFPRTKKTNKKLNAKKFYITTAIDYANAGPHIGHAYEKIMADVLARFHRLLGEDVFFLTGTDEHGQKVERAAQKAGKSPKVFCDETVALYQKLCQELEISHDSFIRTTDEKHMKKCQEIFQIVYKKGDIYKGTYEGLYCTGCERFYLEKELDNGNCPVHKKPVENLKEESYFFRMGKYQDALVKHIKKNPAFILPAFRRNEILERLKEPLRDLSISRTSFTWGIPVPIDQKHIIYVWFDALLNYVTALDYPNKQFGDYWPADVHLIGKDILWFHTVIWPCILMSAGIELPKTVFVHGFINIKGAKLSKSSGLVVDPFALVQKYGADPVRYFFAKEISFGEDGDFSEEALISRSNAELADDLGNLVKRVSTVIQKNFGGTIPEQGTLEEVDKDLIKHLDRFEEIRAAMLSYQTNMALALIWEIIKEVNKYITATEPWRQPESRKATILYNTAEALRIITILISPFIPLTAVKIREQFSFPEQMFKDLAFTKTLKGSVKPAEILFKKFEVSEQPKLPLDLRVAKITDIKDHPEADKLYILQIDLGKEKRQLVAGLRNWYKKEELLNKKIVVIANLKFAKLKGVESQGMLLAASKVVDGNDVAVRTLEAKHSELGAQACFEGFVSEPKKQVSLKDFEQFAMQSQGKKVMHNGKILKTEKEAIYVDIEDGCEVH